MKRRITFTLGLDSSQFTKKAELAFVHVISRLSGANYDEIDLVSVHPGCIKVTIELDEQALAKLLRVLEPKATDLEPLTSDQKTALTELCSQYAYQFFEIRGQNANPRINSSNALKVNKVFFVHGWLGGADSFGAMPDYIAKLTGCKCTSYSYPTGFLKRSVSISFVAMHFDNWIRNELSGSDAQFGIIAHSMGGLIVRDFLGSQLHRSSPLSDRVRQVSFLASPQGGAWLSKIAKLLPISAAQQVADLSPNSEYLGRVNSSWNAWLPRQHHLNSHVRSFFADADEVVDYVSAIGSDPEAIPILDATHTSIIKPTNESDEVVRTIIRLITEAGLAVKLPSQVLPNAQCS